MSVDPQQNIRPFLSVFRSRTRRGKQVCLQCKRRKVACDGTLPTCHTCERLGFKCSFIRSSESSVESISTDDRPRRLRGRNACTQCRMRKIRCSNTLPQCSNCARRNRACSYLASNQPPPPSERPVREIEDHFSIGPSVEPQIVHDTFATPGTDTTESGVSLFESSGQRCHPGPSHEEATELVLRFFEYLYPVPSYSFLHPLTIISRCKHGSLERPLLLAICAVTSLRLFLGNVGQEVRSAWVDHAEEIIWRHLERPSMPRLQALLLTISYRMETGSFEKAFMLTGIAARAASAMGLNHEHTHLDRISEETRRRTVWCFKLLESYFSIGLPEFELCPFECIYLRPPIREDEFGPRLFTAEDTAIGSFGDRNELGALNICIRLLSIRRDIMKLTRELAVCDEPFLQLTRVTRSLETALLELQTEMPNRGEISQSDLMNLIESSWLPRHLMMVTLWNGCFCDIYRIFLPGYPEAPPLAVLGAIDSSHAQRAKTICMEHALATINLICDLNQNCTSPRSLEFANGVSAYHATRLMLFIAHSSNEPHLPNLEFAVSRAELCLAAIKRFFRASALAQPIIDDLAQLIQTFSSHTSAMESLAVFHQANRGRNFTLQIPSAARARERLAVHSLLRQAEFSDDDTVSTPRV